MAHKKDFYFLFWPSELVVLSNQSKRTPLSSYLFFLVHLYFLQTKVHFAKYFSTLGLKVGGKMNLFISACNII